MHKWSFLRGIEEAFFKQKSHINWLRLSDHWSEHYILHAHCSKLKLLQCHTFIAPNWCSSHWSNRTMWDSIGSFHVHYGSYESTSANAFVHLVSPPSHDYKAIIELLGNKLVHTQMYTFTMKKIQQKRVDDAFRGVVLFA